MHFGKRKGKKEREEKATNELLLVTLLVTWAELSFRSVIRVPYKRKFLIENLSIMTLHIHHKRSGQLQLAEVL